jgi:hypothetical protein
MCLLSQEKVQNLLFKKLLKPDIMPSMLWMLIEAHHRLNKALLNWLFKMML